MADKKLVVFLVLTLLFPGVAHAYVDPGTGAYLLQLLIALFGAVVFYAARPRQLFQLIRDFFTKKNKK
jgi:hypothetical protein